MTTNLHLISLLVGIFFSIIFPIVICFHRKRVFALWARIASVIVCLAGLGWGFIGLALLHSSVIDWNYSRQNGIKEMLGGIGVGLCLSILLSKPYEKRVATRLDEKADYRRKDVSGKVRP